MLGVAAAAAAMLMAGCQEEKESPTLMSLAVNDTTMNVTAKSGSEHVLVYSKSRWKVAFEEAADWLTLDRTEGDGNGEFIVKFTENAGLMRRAKLLISASGVDKVIPFTINQEGALGNPKLSFAVTEKTYIAWAVSDALEFNANVPEDEIKAVASEDWITDLKIEDGKLNFNVAENTTGQERTAALSLEYTDIDKNVYRAVATISQTAQAGHLVLDETSMTVEAYEAVKSVPWDCVLGTFMPALKLSVEYEGAQSDWITDLAATEENLTFKVAENTVKAERKAVIKAELAEKNVVATLSITQMQPSKQYTFEELRGLLASAGEYTFDGDWFEAVAVADAGMENMETNPMTAPNAYDADESAKTNYVQSADGKYGFRLKFAAAADNTLKKGDKVKISLNGLTLVREDAPVRYTLKGLNANAVAVEENVAVAARKKTVGELTDDDIYTWVTLKDVEIAFSYGSYNNIRTTWIDTKYQNLDYRILNDKSGDKIDMLVNSDTKWWLTKDGVPKGAGDVSGVIVNTTTSFHDAKLLGKYQIRPMELSDIALGDTGFSNTLVEWFFQDGPGNHKDGNNFPSSSGTGTMSSDAVTINQTDSYLNYEGKPDTASDRLRGMRYDGTWWKDGAPRDYVKWDFSTKECAGKKLYFVFSSALGRAKEDIIGQAPVNWNLRYSVNDGEFKLIEKVFIRPLPDKNSTLMCLPSALDEYCIDLPAEIAGQDKVTLSLTAADDTTIDFTTGEYTAKVTFVPDKKNKGQYFRFGAVAVKYVK